MICPKCSYEQPDGGLECVGCGVIFAKIRDASPDTAPSAQPSTGEAEEDSFSWRNLLLPEQTEVNPIALAFRALLWVALAIWGAKFIFASVGSNYAGESIIHLVNLPFHEAGHIFFRPFGRFLMVLGGSLMQLLIPAVCAAVLLLRTRDAFGASVALWWLAQNFMDIAPYINDARDLNLMLLGGVTGKDVADYHDWEYLLGKLGLLRMDHFLANLSQLTGIVIMLTAMLWGAIYLKKSFPLAKLTS